MIITRKISYLIALSGLISLVSCKSTIQPYGSLSDLNFKVFPYIEHSGSTSKLIYQIDVAPDEDIFLHGVNNYRKSDTLFFYFVGVVSYPERGDTTKIEVEIKDFDKYVEKEMIFWKNKGGSSQKLKILAN